VVEAGDSRWLSTVKSAIEEGLKNTPNGSKQQIFFYTDDGAKVFPAQPSRVVQESGFAAFLQGIRPSIDAEAVEVIEKAIASNPEQIILVTGRPLPSPATTKLSELIYGKGIRLDVVMISSEQSELRHLARDNEGNYWTIPADQINEWYAKSHE
jgi:hypothetical protein